MYEKEPLQVETYYDPVVGRYITKCPTGYAVGAIQSRFEDLPHDTRLYQQ